MDRVDRLIRIAEFDQYRNLDLAGGDHLDVDVCFGERLEHLGRDARVGLHPRADDRDLGDVVVADDPLSTAPLVDLLHQLHCELLA